MYQTAQLPGPRVLLQLPWARLPPGPLRRPQVRLSRNNQPLARTTTSPKFPMVCQPRPQAPMAHRHRRPVVEQTPREALRHASIPPLVRPPYLRRSSISNSSNKQWPQWLLPHSPRRPLAEASAREPQHLHMLHRQRQRQRRRNQRPSKSLRNNQTRRTSHYHRNRPALAQRPDRAKGHAKARDLTLLLSSMPSVPMPTPGRDTAISARLDRVPLAVCSWRTRSTRTNAWPSSR